MRTGLDTQDMSPLVLLFFDKQRIVFNAGEVLKETLASHGYVFESETYIEVTPNMAKFVFDKANGEEETTTDIQFHDINVLKNDQPKELFKYSDAHALVEHTKNYMVIEDNEVVHLKIF